MTAIMTEYHTSPWHYKSEGYVRCTLYFKWWFIRWSIIYDLTMFDDRCAYYDLWDDLIKNKSKIKLSAIKERRIF